MSATMRPSVRMVSVSTTRDHSTVPARMATNAQERHVLVSKRDKHVYLYQPTAKNVTITYIYIHVYGGARSMFY